MIQAEHESLQAQYEADQVAISESMALVNFKSSGSELEVKCGLKTGDAQIHAQTRLNSNCARANSTKTPSPRIDSAERPTDPARRGKEGSRGGIKKEPNAQAPACAPPLPGA